MVFDYAKSQATADRLIARFGQAGTIRRRSSAGGAYEPDPAQTISDHPCKLVVTDYTVRERESTLIGSSDRKVLVAMSGLDIVPTSADRITVAGDTLEIINVMPLSPGGTTVLYEIQARA
ncbi:hypothetical protein GCM10011390_41720 [Aureimonas endophytica]|uniref:Head-tail joining protein n=1 Tax=Aureimonas endophytica TaxID=2027858 RepID=A0A916ZZK2_9HYPH|nr:hypothetical protein [Aureimonas endophytica]GGE18200.1 hypothetical protein GCM10011390_41720 [Aureimonas endophytica]